MNGFLNRVSQVRFLPGALTNVVFRVILVNSGGSARREYVETKRGVRDVDAALNLDAAEVDRIFREESGRSVATLISRFGDIDVAEDAVHEAFAVALRTWPGEGLPPNPGRLDHGDRPQPGHRPPAPRVAWTPSGSGRSSATPTPGVSSARSRLVFGRGRSWNQLRISACWRCPGLCGAATRCWVSLSVSEAIRDRVAPPWDKLMCLGGSVQCVY
jgi:hypothetical protein